MDITAKDASTSSARSTALDKSNFSLPVEIQLKIIDYYLENLIRGA